MHISLLIWDEHSPDLFLVKQVRYRWISCPVVAWTNQLDQSPLPRAHSRHRYYRGGLRVVLRRLEQKILLHLLTEPKYKQSNNILRDSP